MNEVLIMKASLSEYMKALSGNQFSILEEIISSKYRKFMLFFDLIKEYSKDIDKMRYNFTDESTLDIELGMKNSIKRSLKEDLISEMLSSGYEVKSEISGKKMKLTIIYDESKLI